MLRIIADALEGTVDTAALAENAQMSADPATVAAYSKMAFGPVGSSLLDRYAAGDAGASFWLILIACAAACIFIPYFLGSINFGIIVSKLFHKEDIRSYGSGNAGATNMLRTYGKRDAALTFLGDVLKCVVSVALGRVLFGLTGGYIALFCCIVGHAFPVFYKFKGGKGVAAAAGGVAALFAFTPDWWIILAELGVFIIVVAITRFISLGSVTAMFVFPLLMSRFELGWSLNILFSFMIAALVIFLHRENIKRIYKGTESKFSLKHTDKHEKDG
jgi:glycerol-3-phosphate acyltransferase PlsY